jgi:hypothetical protein
MTADGAKQKLMFEDGCFRFCPEDPMGVRIATGALPE